MLNDVQRQALGAMYTNTPGSSLDWGNLVDLQQLEAEDLAYRQAKQEAKEEQAATDAYIAEDAANAAMEGIANSNPGSTSIGTRNTFLDKAASNKGTGNARTSIVDLLKSLGIEDTSYGARKKMAIDMGIPEELLRSSAKMNQWLHDRISYQMGDAGKSIDEVIPERARKAEQTARTAAGIAQNYYNPPIYKKGWM